MSSTAPSLTLLIPHLLWPEPADQIAYAQLASAPAASWLLARGRFSQAAAQSFEQALAASFGLTDPALAEFRRLGETTLPPAATAAGWLCADPVHLRFHHERIVLADAGAFEISAEEAKALCTDLSREFAEIGEFEAATPRRWYLRLRTAVNHCSPPLSAVAGRRIAGELPTAAADLSRWLNEAQMFLHLHPINQRRQAAGQPAINSLWLWGQGQQRQPQTGFDQVWSDNPLVLGLAAAANCPRATLPEPAEIFARARAGERQLLVLDQLLAPVLYENGEEWNQTWQSLARDWLAPIRAELGRSLRTVDLHAPTIFGHLHWQLSGIDRWQPWRGRRDPAALALQLAGPPAA